MLQVGFLLTHLRQKGPKIKQVCFSYAHLRQNSRKSFCKKG